MRRNSTVQIKEIAKRLALSPGTVSIVLSGKGKSVRISDATQKRIFDAAKEMNYQPNMYTRRLRNVSGERTAKIIAIFWCTDFSDDTMGHFFKGLYKTICEKKHEVDLFVQLFDFNCLSKCKNLMTSSRFSGIIISGTSDLDIQFLNENTFDLPIILMNRNEQRYHCVYVNDYEIGSNIGRLFHTRGHKCAGLITVNRKGHSVTLRQLGFMEFCSKNQIEVGQEWVQEAGGRDFAAGYEATKRLLAGDKEPTAMFVMSPGLVLGTVQACNDSGLSIPADIEVITFGDGDVFPFYVPSISSVYIPIEATAENALNLLILVIDNDIQMPMSRMLLAGYTFRDSCGGFL